MRKIPKAISSIVKKIAGQNLSLEHIVFLCGAAAGIALSAFGFIGNLLMGLPPIAILIPFVNLLLDISCVVYSIRSKKWRGAALIVFIFASFVLFPFLWFTTGGTMSSSLPLVIGLGVILAIVFRGWQRIFLFFSTLILYSVLIMVELHHPNNFIPYPNRESWYIDVLIGFVLSFLATGGVAYSTLLHFNIAKRKTEVLVHQLEKISISDPLTGVYNRRHLMARIDEEMRKSFDNGHPLTLCIIDIDHFKKVNDNYGHVYGDEVLMKITSTISENLEENAILGRYGGEEFIVLFPESDLPSSLESIEKFYEALRQTKWSHGKPITISAGVSTYSKGISYSEFLKNADSNLYKAKSNGRNRVEH